MLQSALRDNGLNVAGQGSSGGSSLWLRMPDGTDTSALALKLRAQGVLIEPGAPFFASEAPPTEFMRLAYSSILASRISEGVRLIAEAALDLPPQANWP